MAMTFSGFLPGESVQLQRPAATPNVPAATLETAVADSAGVVTFAASESAGAHYRAAAPSRRAWRVTAGADAAGVIPPIWSSVP